MGIIMNISFRSMSESDGDDVIDMVLSLYSEDPGGKVMDRDKVRRTLDILIKEPCRGSIVVMEEEGEVEGYAILINYWSNEYGGNVVNLDVIFVKARSRGKGLGSAFIQHLIDSRGGDSVAIMLEVLPTNGRAIEFYRKNGFLGSRYDHMVLEFPSADREGCKPS